MGLDKSSNIVHDSPPAENGLGPGISLGGRTEPHILTEGGVAPGRTVVIRRTDDSPPHHHRTDNRSTTAATMVRRHRSNDDGPHHRTVNCTAQTTVQKFNNLQKHMNKFMREAIKEAETGVKKGHGGPFGAVVVCRGKIIARGHNEVILHNDPTNHAEIVAIRKAAKKLKRFDLGDCEMFITCEPCPMCLGAVYWAKIKKITFGCTRKDAAKIGFDDEFIYDVFRGGASGKGEAANKGKAARKGSAINKGKAARAAEASTEQVRTVKKYRKECLKVFDAFVKKQDKVMY